MVDVEVPAIADVLEDIMDGIRDSRSRLESYIFVVLTHRLVVAVFLKKSFALPPGDDDLSRVDIVDQPGMRVDPSGLPFPAANMLEELNALERRALESGPFAEAVFSPHSPSDPENLHLSRPTANSSPSRSALFPTS